ncbi:unnamed protein product, partial [Prorocentrum cordatum]
MEEYCGHLSSFSPLLQWLQGNCEPLSQPMFLGPLAPESPGLAACLGGASKECAPAPWRIGSDGRPLSECRARCPGGEDCCDASTWVSIVSASGGDRAVDVPVPALEGGAK